MPSDPFYSSAAWLQLRRKFLADHPVCDVPGCGKPSRHADHRISRRRGGAPLDPRNLRALCHRCHSRLTAKFDGGGGNPIRDGKAEAGAPGCDASGQPLDPGHPWNRGR